MVQTQEEDKNREGITREYIGRETDLFWLTLGYVAVIVGFLLLVTYIRMTLLGFLNYLPFVKLFL